LLRDLARDRERAADPLRAASWLRKRLPAEVARRAAELLALRDRARGRFIEAESCYLTRKGLQQATRTAVARARARHIASHTAPDETVFDATCGVGGDSLALAEHGLQVVSADREFEPARCCLANLARLDARPWVVVADATSAAVRASYWILDPDRRPEGSRREGPDRWAPTLRECIRLLRRARGGCLKLPPGMDPLRLGAALGEASDDRPVDWQWVSHRRELCELALWFGEWAGARAPESGGYEALALDLAGEQETRLCGPRESVPALDHEAAARVAWMAEPDPAVIRSGLLGKLARSEGLAPLGPKLAYLGGDRRPSSALLSSWRVVETCQADARRVRQMLARHAIGPLTVMKRGHPDDAQTLAKRLSGPGDRPGLLAVARTSAGHLALLLESA
jgi:hypothetical protein